MSLPFQAVERLFDRLTATYGRQFLNLYEGVEANAIKASWSHELSGFASNLQAVAWALENLPERAPNAIEFRNLCRRAPAPEVPRLPDPPADPQRIRAELAKLAPIIEAVKQGNPPQKLDWARRIVARVDGGERMAPLTVRMAREALIRRGAEA